MAPKPSSIAGLAVNLRGTSHRVRPWGPGYPPAQPCRQIRLWRPGRWLFGTNCLSVSLYSSEMSIMRDATIARCTQTPNNIRANKRLRDCNQQHCSAAAPEATTWGVSVQLLHLVRNRSQCDVRPAFGRCERVQSYRSFVQSKS
jgi:hypothetical protein